MKFLTITICTAVILFACNNEKEKAAEPKLAAAATSTPSEATAQVMPDSITMKNWENYKTPGEAHKLMASWSGTWTGEVTMWMAAGQNQQKVLLQPLTR